MDYDRLLNQVVGLLQRKQRLSYRVLKRWLQLDGELLEDLKEDLIYAKHLAVDEEGKVLVLRGASGTPPGRTSPARGRSRVSGGRLAPRRPGVFVLVALLLMPAVVQAQTMRWEDAVAALAEERTRAETCVRLLKRHAGNDAATLSRGEVAYTDAKANVDAVIGGLIVVLAQRGTPTDLADLEPRLTRGVQAREAFCTQVIALVPPDPRLRDVRGELVGAFVKLLQDAVRTLHGYITEEDHLRRKTIQTQLEATQWSAFAVITP
jgi:hypothetical protein